MPILKKIALEDGIIGLWKLTETSEVFNSLIPAGSPDKLRFDKITYKKRKVEFLATRAMLKEFLGHYPLIQYQKDGRPYLPNDALELSISHSRDIAAVILHKYRVGIDVEIEGRDIDKIARKFMSAEELLNISESENHERMQLLHWCAKEAVFKCTHHAGIDFRSQINIDKFEVFENGKMNAVLKKNAPENIEVNYQFIENNALAWCYQK